MEGQLTNMKLKDLLDTLRTEGRVEIRDQDNNSVCVCETDSKGVEPYRELKVVEWFVFSPSPFNNKDFCVLLEFN